MGGRKRRGRKVERKKKVMNEHLAERKMGAGRMKEQRRTRKNGEKEKGRRREERKERGEEKRGGSYVNYLLKRKSAQHLV